MESLISAYASYDDAAKTIEDLKQAGYNENELLVVNRDDIVNHNIRVKSDGRIEQAELAVVSILGAVAGILLGTGAVVVPGFHFVYHSPIWMALVIGLGVGLGALAGETLALLTNVVIYEINAIKYEPMFRERKFLLFVQGEKDEITYAEKIAHTEGLHLELSSD